jgi:hypothetical protein
MNKRTANIFKLIPSKQSRTDYPAPMYFMPALPVRFEQGHSDLNYAIVDATAEISSMQRSLLKSIKHSKKTYDHYIFKDSTTQVKEAEIILISLYLCNPIDEPWLIFYDVPFAIIDQSSKEHQRITLGYNSFLSKLRLSFDFPRKELRISAPIEYEVLKAKSIKYYLPSAITEAENLISIGSYKAAFSMIRAGLDEVLVTKYNDIDKQKLISHLLKQNWMFTKLKSDLKEFIRLRNEAVHGSDLVPIEKKDVQMALNTAIRIIDKLSRNN